jgi:hypothetical protein
VFESRESLRLLATVILLAGSPFVLNLFTRSGLENRQRGLDNVLRQFKHRDAVSAAGLCESYREVVLLFLGK